jgi:hypothetical protein
MEHCSEIAKYTLMLELPWYEYRFYISLFIGSLICSFMPTRSKVIYVIAFNVFAILAYFGIDFLASKKIDHDQLTELIDRCQSENNIKREHFLNKLKDLAFEDPNKKSVDVLDSEEEKYFDERAAISLESVKHKESQLNDRKFTKETQKVEKFANPYLPQDTPSNIKMAGDFKDNVSMNSFKNLPAAFESTYQMIQTPPLPTPPAQVESKDCLLGKDNCSPICSGNNENPCNSQTSVPGPQWQPQHASSVQNRLNKGEFVPNHCPL